jgi:hypothetical protein
MTPPGAASGSATTQGSVSGTTTPPQG